MRACLFAVLFATSCAPALAADKRIWLGRTALQAIDKIEVKPTK
jgi:hypothetical protein